MTIREIRNELEKIYKERKSWQGGKGPFTEPAIRQRELILIKQQILYRIEDAKLLKDKGEECFNLTLYRAINDYLSPLYSYP
ncbi:hypothetical protein LR007_00625 [candidate division NPL-UPA2 bacterium]|nr:hypothetical protein [candidate division NPL-UPA2 bacterium]